MKKETTLLTHPGEKYRDFLLIKKIPIKELKATLYELLHLPTHAEIMHLENEDGENLYCLSFKTLPSSSSGAPHVLEHIVLCGSRKFPVKDPFFSMSRRSLNTYMNALTGSDFTCYPAASQVEKDFYNLLEVYLDAVFHPMLKEESFLQEGQRLEFSSPKDPDSPLEIKGIVYNEMKGSLSSVDSRVWHTVIAKLAPDLPYAYNSGGDPKEIPSLTYADLIHFHETYYHPSRCLFFFYGNIPLKKHLDFIEKHCLKQVQKLPPLPPPEKQKRFEKPLYEEMGYPIAEKTNLEKKTIITIGWLTAFLHNQEDVLALAILDSILMDTDASPLKKALLKSKLCSTADSYLDSEMSEIPYVLVCKGCKKKHAQELEEIIFTALKKIAHEGIPDHLIDAAIHQLEFHRTEITSDHAPFGLTLFFRSGLAKQHGCPPENSLMVHSLFETLLKKVKHPNFFKELISRYFLHNSHFIRLTFYPDPQMGYKEMEEEKKKLELMKKKLSEKEIAKVIEQAELLRVYQEQTEKQKTDCLPKISLSDIPRKEHDFSLSEKVKENISIFHSNQFTNHILYADLIFPLPHLTESELFYCKLFAILWTELGTKKNDYQKQLEMVHAHTGGVGAFFNFHTHIENSTIQPYIHLKGKALNRKASHLFEIFKDLIFSPRFDEVERIEELISQLSTSLQNSLSKNAMKYAIKLASSSSSIGCFCDHEINGLNFYQNLQKLMTNLKAKMAELLTHLEQISKKALRQKPQLILSCDEEMSQDLEQKNYYQLPSHPFSQTKDWSAEFPLKSVSSHARSIASPVAFNVLALKSIHYLHPLAPALYIATHLLENKVLHRRIREQGGAYGCGANFNSLWKQFYFYSFRDQHIARTLRAFSQSLEEIGSGNFDEDDVEEAKLGMIQQLDHPVSPGSRAMVAYTWLQSGKTKPIRQKFREDILAVTSKEIKKVVNQHLMEEVKTSTIVSFGEKELVDKENLLMKPEFKPLLIKEINE
ncbi:MAG: insulinase family protein [Chlamydiae bacterium]|nr:insulinase family protein [Chlamydiota bacterium]